MVPTRSAANRPARIPCAGAVVRDEAGRLLLVRRANEPSRGLWSLPGGRVEAGETGEEAAAREVLEETGLRVKVGGLLLTVEVGDYDIRDYEATVVGGELVAGDDATDVRWCNTDELAILDLTPGLLEALRRVGILRPLLGH